MQRTFQISGIFSIILFLFSFHNCIEWKPIGPLSTPMPEEGYKGWSANGIGRVFDIAVHTKNANIIWLCSPNGGLFYTKNRGKKWKQIPLPTPGGAIHIERTPIDQRAYRLFVASNISMSSKDPYSYGVFSTDNNGKTWDTIHPLFPSEYNLSTIGIMKWFNNQLIYSVNENVYRFTNGRQTLLHTANSKLTSIVLHPTNPDLWYLCGKNICFTKDNGKSFTYLKKNKKTKELFEAKRCDLAFDHALNGVLIAHQNRGNFRYEIKSNENIETETRINAVIDVHRTKIIFDSKRHRFLIGGIRLYSLKNDQFQQLSYPNFPHNQFMHDDIRVMTFDNHGNILIGHDGGISISENGGVKWFNINGCGLNITEVYDFDFSAEALIAGAQDLSSFQLNRKNNKWTHFSNLYSDGGSCILKNDTWYVMKSLQLVNTTNQGKNFNYPYVPVKTSRFNPELCLSDNTLFYAGKQLWKEQNGTWKNLSPLIESNYDVTGLIIHNNFMLLSKADPVWRSEDLKGKLYRSSNKGKTWQDITSNFKAYAYREISDLTSKTNFSHIYACIGSFDNPKGNKEKVYESIDSGNTWKNISYNLPNIPCTCITFIDKIGLLLGTDQGLFILQQNKWVKYRSELPEVPITKIRYKYGKLIVSTYGRGLWILK